MKRVASDKTAKYSERANMLRAAMQAVRMLGQLTGELGASESAVAASPQWKRLLAELLEALQPYPDASRAVLERLERWENAA